MKKDNLTISIPLPVPAKVFKKKFIFIALGIFFLILFYSFSIFVKEDKFTHFDFNMTVKIQDKTPHKLDPYLSALSILGNFESTILILFFFLFFTQITKIRLHGKTILQKLIEFVKHPMAGFIVIFMFTFVHVVELVGKTFLDHPGPPRFMLRSLSSSFPQFYIFTPGSYPSGHSMRMIFLLIVFTAIIFSIKKLPQSARALFFLFLVGYSALMLFSRISLGEHWTTDVIGGSMLGAAFGFFSLIFLL